MLDLRERMLHHSKRPDSRRTRFLPSIRKEPGAKLPVPAANCGKTPALLWLQGYPPLPAAFHENACKLESMPLRAGACLCRLRPAYRRNCRRESLPQSRWSASREREASSIVAQVHVFPLFAAAFGRRSPAPAPHPCQGIGHRKPARCSSRTQGLSLDRLRCDNARPMPAKSSSHLLAVPRGHFQHAILQRRPKKERHDIFRIRIIHVIEHPTQILFSPHFFGARRNLVT